MSRMYSVIFEAVTVSAAQDLFEITPATNKPIKVHAIYLSQTSDVKEAEEEILLISIRRGYSTSGSGGTTPTPAALNSATATAAGFTSEVNNTTVASTGTPVTLHSEAWNVRVGYQFIPTPEMRPGISAASTRLVVRLVNAPADALTMSGTMIIEEEG